MVKQKVAARRVVAKKSTARGRGGFAAKHGGRGESVPRGRTAAGNKSSPAAKDGGEKKLTYAQAYDDYMTGRVRLRTYQRVGVALLIVVLAGFVGWVWEFVLAEFGGGFRHLYIKGGNLLPWMNIYAYGAMLIIAVSYKLRRYPWAVFVASALACGLLELFAGWVVYTVGNGTRYWDYSHAWWAVGNINGFVAPLSACAFGLGALALMYGLLPRCIYWARRMTRRAFLGTAIALFTVIMVDDLTNLALKNLGLPTAQDLYLKMGWVFK